MSPWRFPECCLDSYQTHIRVFADFSRKHDKGCDIQFTVLFMFDRSYLRLTIFGLANMEVRNIVLFCFKTPDSL
jgi:hypothetical protein